MITSAGKSPSHVVVDTSDGYVFWRDVYGALFDQAAAERFANARNVELPENRRTYSVFALVAAETAPERSPRKVTAFAPCERHAPMYAGESRRRRAEVMCEGGYASPRECSGGKCSMRPGTDFFTADFVAANPTYLVRGAE